MILHDNIYHAHLKALYGAIFTFWQCIDILALLLGHLVYQRKIPTHTMLHVFLYNI